VLRHDASPWVEAFSFARLLLRRRPCCCTDAANARQERIKAYVRWNLTRSDTLTTQQWLAPSDAASVMLLLADNLGCAGISAPVRGYRVRPGETLWCCRSLQPIWRCESLGFVRSASNCRTVGSATLHFLSPKRLAPTPILFTAVPTGTIPGPWSCQVCDAHHPQRFS